MKRQGVILFLLSSSLVCAQEFRATISGAVTDQQGAAIPKVSIVATETRTGTKSTALSEDTGGFTIPFLAPGEYQVSAEAPGFKKFIRSGLKLSSGERPVIDIRLEVGAISDSVTVRAEARLVVSSTSAVGQVVTSREVEDIPVNGRAPTMLASLAMA